jgi:DeoR/GlpR family transcriptional regulator of sugar metabolism
MAMEIDNFIMFNGVVTNALTFHYIKDTNIQVISKSMDIINILMAFIYFIVASIIFRAKYRWLLWRWLGWFWGMLRD